MLVRIMTATTDGERHREAPHLCPRTLDLTDGTAEELNHEQIVEGSKQSVDHQLTPIRRKKGLGTTSLH